VVSDYLSFHKKIINCGFLKYINYKTYSDNTRKFNEFSIYEKICLLHLKDITDHYIKKETTRIKIEEKIEELTNYGYRRNLNILEVIELKKELLKLNEKIKDDFYIKHLKNDLRILQQEVKKLSIKKQKQIVYDKTGDPHMEIIGYKDNMPVSRTHPKKRRSLFTDIEDLKKDWEKLKKEKLKGRKSYSQYIIEKCKEGYTELELVGWLLGEGYFYLYNPKTGKRLRPEDKEDDVLSTFFESAYDIGGLEKSLIMLGEIKKHAHQTGDVSKVATSTPLSTPNVYEDKTTKKIVTRPAKPRPYHPDERSNT